MSFPKNVKKIIGVILTLCCLHSKGQTLTPKDFKLFLDGREKNDSVITVKELLETIQITTNFPWLTFKDIGIYISCKTCTETYITVCPGNIVCRDAKNAFKKLKEGDIVIFQAVNATNKSGHPLTVSDLVLYIK